MMLVAAFLVSLVVDRAARHGAQAARARAEAALLGSYARSVLTNPRPLQPLLEKVRENFGLMSVTLLEKQGGVWRRLAASGAPAVGVPPDAEVPITPEVRLSLRGRTLPAADLRTLESAAGHALLALRHQRMTAEADRASRKAETAELRNALLSALGHDLRTPLTSIKAAIAGLRDDRFPPSPGDAAELLETVEESADRLSGLVENLLDSSRLATGAVRPRREPVGYDDVVARVLSGSDGGPAVEVAVPHGIASVLADPGLLERVVANLVDNALRYGVPPPGEPAAAVVAIRATAHAGRVELRVVDRGQGLPGNATDSAFQPFQRLGDRDTSSGVGLGLSVAKGFTEAMGGTLRAEDTPGGGLTMVVSLPEFREDHPIQ
jgi:two-component system sensor histidine kinase KdpD